VEQVDQVWVLQRKHRLFSEVLVVAEKVVELAAPPHFVVQLITEAAAVVVVIQLSREVRVIRVLLLSVGIK
jgi:hypothetical protein